MTTTTKPLNDQQCALIAAINGGIGDLRRLQAAAGYGSISTVKTNLKQLAARGEIILLPHCTQTRVYTGVDFARGWNAAASLAGNPDA